MPESFMSLISKIPLKVLSLLTVIALSAVTGFVFNRLSAIESSIALDNNRITRIETQYESIKAQLDRIERNQAQLMLRP